MLNLVTCLDGTHVLECYVVRRGSTNGYQKDMCIKDIELFFKIDIHSRLNGLNIWEVVYDHMNEHVSFHSDNE